VQQQKVQKDTTSGGYRYKEPAKNPANNKKDSLPGKQAKADTRMTLPTAFIQRFSI
jgi:hypothetical protein